LEYEKWRNDQGDDSILDEILLYNKDDVESTQLLRDWLEERRSELIHDGVDVPRPEVKDIDLGAKINLAIQQRVDALLAGIDPAVIERIRHGR
ncbi:MAG: ribonuclease H-like domain-containing protein, partial [Ilumatobacteraceae bacterium]